VSHERTGWTVDSSPQRSAAGNCVTLDGLELQVQDKKLTLFGRIRQTADEIVQVLHQEYQIGHFFRSFILSDDVDHDRIEARFEGILGCGSWQGVL